MIHLLKWGQKGVKSGSNGLAAAGTSGNIFITSSEAVIKHTNATPDSFYVLCVKK